MTASLKTWILRTLVTLLALTACPAARADELAEPAAHIAPEPAAVATESSEEPLEPVAYTET
ncbi:MAG: hypothetical protein O3C39_04705, partial [Planctomycetota bacterium]|nr:hypothetical protein [Planctomycetota bacterium]